MKVKKILAALSAIVIAGSMSIASASATWMHNLPTLSEGNEVILTDGDFMVYSDGECVQTSGKRDFSINYIVKSGTAVNAEYLGLSGADVTKLESSDEEGTETFSVAAESEAELDKLMESAETLLKDGKIVNAYKQMTFDFHHKFRNLVITLKEEDKNFDFNKLNVLDYDIDVTQSESDPKVYKLASTSVFYTDYESIVNKIMAVDNVADVTSVETECEFEHDPVTMKTYLVYEEEINGDANGDGVVNVRDAAFIARALAQKNVNEKLLKSADFNKDGNVNIRDAAAIARHVCERNVK